MVPRAGIEPARHFCRGILSPLCLPISPPGLSTVDFIYYGLWSLPGLLSCPTPVHLCTPYTNITPWTELGSSEMEAGVGIEPALTELQSAA